MAFIYILESLQDGKFYTGSTVDLKRRLEQHRSGKVKSTKSRLPVKLVYFEKLESELKARQREIFLKTPAGGVTKKVLVRDFLMVNPDPEQLL